MVSSLLVFVALPITGFMRSGSFGNSAFVQLTFMGITVLSF